MTTDSRKRDNLSPILFSIIIGEIIAEVRSAGKGYLVRNEEIRIVCYADGAVIISEDEDTQKI